MNEEELKKDNSEETKEVTEESPEEKETLKLNTKDDLLSYLKSLESRIAIAEEMMNPPATDEDDTLAKEPEKPTDEQIDEVEQMLKEI